MSDHEAEFGLVMPFVTVSSKGGPHDDGAYVAGYEMGLLDHALAVASVSGLVSVRRTLRTENRSQADLLAMRHGFVMTVEPHGDEWFDARFDLGEDRDEV